MEMDRDCQKIILKKLPSINQNKTNYSIINRKPPQIYDVIFNDLPFYNSIFEIQKLMMVHFVLPTTSDIAFPCKDFNEFEIEFNLPVSVASMIESNPPESMQLQIRFGRKGGMTELSEGLPVLIQIYINNHKETAENSPIHFDCKPFLNLSGKNVIKISDWPYSFRPYYMVVDIVQKLTVEYMIEQVKICNRERSLMLHTKSKAMEIMKISEKKSDMEMCESKSYTINLLCPITNLKMKLPTRSLKCVHLQCFDLHSFFTLYKVKPIWKCPVCHKPIMLNDLVLDTFLLNIVNSANLPEICDRIIIYRNGNVEASLKHLKPKVNIIEYNLSE